MTFFGECDLKMTVKVVRSDNRQNEITLKLGQDPTLVKI